MRRFRIQRQSFFFSIGEQARETLFRAGRHFQLRTPQPIAVTGLVKQVPPGPASGSGHGHERAGQAVCLRPIGLLLRSGPGVGRDWWWLLSLLVLSSSSSSSSLLLLLFPVVVVVVVAVVVAAAPALLLLPVGDRRFMIRSLLLRGARLAD